MNHGNRWASVTTHIIFDIHGRLSDKVKTDKRRFLLFRCWETSVPKFEHDSTSICGLYINRCGEIRNKEACRLGYKKDTRRIIDADKNIERDE